MIYDSAWLGLQEFTAANAACADLHSWESGPQPNEIGVKDFCWTHSGDLCRISKGQGTLIPRGGQRMR
jgi:hypothetical protein